MRTPWLVPALLAISLAAAVPLTRAQFLPRPTPTPTPRTVVVRAAPCFGARSYVVRASANAASANGAAASPFRTIAAALAAAQSSGGCSVAIQVLPGTYADALEITRDTEIVGDERSAVVLTGTVHNAGAHSLRITRLTFRNTLSPAAIDVRHAEARTLVDHVTIEGARDGAIRHVGGALTAISVAINGTVTTPASPRRGAALRFEDASGSVALSSVSGGDAQALVIRGAAAHVEVNGFDVTDISMLERFRAAASVGASESAVVEVGGQARARLIGLGVTRAMIGGLTVRDGAEVRAEALSVLDTRDFATPPHTNTPFGVAVIDATAQFVDFRIDQSALIGMGLAGAQVTVGPGEIHNSRIGLWLTRAPANWDLDDCFYSVGTGGTNEVDIEMSTLPIPDISAAMGIDMANPTAPPAACPTVLWP